MNNLKCYIIFMLVLSSTFLMAQQAPQGFNYQGVARGSDGNSISNSLVGVRISLLEGSATGSIAYIERHAVITTDLGTFSLVIGEGEVDFGEFEIIDWGAESMYVKVELDPDGGTSFINMGAQQLLSVPYALYAANGGGGGVQGPPGPEGQQGIQGLQGPTGMQGVQGIAGPAGAGVTIIGSVVNTSALNQNYAGETGDMFITQDNGHGHVWNGSSWDDVGQIQGPTGPQGTQGQQGLTGLQGLQGTTGATGPQGDQGEQGQQGPSGVQGTQGLTGAIGPQGAQGEQGQQGTAGTQGQQGTQGPAGTGVQIIGAVNNAGGLDANYNGNIGDMFISQDNGHGHVWNGSSWDDVGQIQGPVGPQGITGSTGPQGAQGLQGTTGTTGATGQTGAQGSSGAPGATGPQGLQGDTGATGPQGAQGLQGDTGLQGITGATGSAGAQGLQGATGATGPAGAQGTTGQTGPQGTQGDTGATGAQGPPGTYTIGNGLSLNGDVISAVDASATNELQSLSVAGSNLTISNGNTVALPNTSLWSENGTAAYYNAGSVGIGTNNPDDKFHIAYANGNDIFSSGSGGWTYNTANENWYGGVSSYGFAIYSNNAPTASRFRITSAGHLVINRGTGGASNAALHITQFSTGVATAGIAYENTAGGSIWNTNIWDDDDFVFSFGGVAKAWIQDNDGVYVTGSDKKLKQDILPVGNVLSDVNKLRLVSYKFKTNPDAPHKSWGFISQEVEVLFPDFISEKNGIKGLAYSNFGVLAIKAIQEQQEIINQQTATINQQSEKIESLEKRFVYLEKRIKRLEEKQK